MAKSHKTYFNWSSGKDSVLALHLLTEKNVEIDLLLTTVNARFDRVSMHGVRSSVLEAQARSLGIALDVLKVPENPSMADYNSIMADKISALRLANYTQTVFGDIFLEDLRRYREAMLAPFGIKALFPLWKKNTRALIKQFLALRYRALIVCVNTAKLDASFLGLELDKTLIKRLPDDVDPCGENGEFHTFCFDGPVFKKAVSVKVAEKVFRTYTDPTDKNGRRGIQFGFCDLMVEADPRPIPKDFGPAV